ncbi:hypothetical protein MKC90_15065 [[Clostridium] innocuum]|nr:hypothetical protein [[Clostridium] innocuum]
MHTDKGCIHMAAAGALKNGCTMPVSSVFDGCAPLNSVLPQSYRKSTVFIQHQFNRVTYPPSESPYVKEAWCSF